MIYIVYSVVCRYLFAINRFSGGENYIRYMLYIEVAISVPLLFYSFSHYSKDVTPRNKSWAIFSLVYLLGLELLNTFLFSSIYSYVVVDFVFWCLFFAMFFLGSSEDFWKMFMTYAVIILLFACAESVLELATNTFTYIRGAVDESSYLYDIQMGFDVLQIILVYFVLTKQKTLTIITLVAFAFYFVLQFLFQKRLPLLRILLIVFFLIYASRSWLSRTRMKSLYVIIAIVAVVAVSLIPAEYYSATKERFFERGSVAETTETDSRFLIAGRAISHTFNNPKNLLIGEGLGGTITGDFIAKTINANGKEVDGIAEIEVGAATIFFRYGILFFIPLFFKFLEVLFKFKRYQRNPLALSCWVYLAVFIIMTFIGESFPGSQTPINTLMVAGSLGYLCSPYSKSQKGFFEINRHNL